jgi:hypothetical protein
MENMEDELKSTVMLKTGFLVLQCLLLTNMAFANGGPVAWSKTSPLGAIALVQQSDATLKAERLNIVITDYNRYSVNAQYTVAVSGPARQIVFGVPIRWTDEEMETGADYCKAKKASGLGTIEKNITIAVNNKVSACKSVESIPASINAPPDSLPATVRAWCVADIYLNKGDNVIDLSYQSELDYVDMEFSKSALTEFDDRRLDYWFYPAGYWSGVVDHVRVDINPGPYKGLVKNSVPENFQTRGDTLVWEGHQVDFKKTPKLALTFDSDPLHENQLATWNASKHYINFKDQAKVTASSVMAQSGRISYAPDKVLDGDPATAWCSDNKKAEQRSYIQFDSIEATFGAKKEEYCRIEGITLTDGYMKNQSVYAANNKITKIAIEACDGSNRKVFDLKNAGDYRSSAQFIHKYNGFDFINDTSCFRVEILEVEKGKDNDTCISEVSVVTNCG